MRHRIDLEMSAPLKLQPEAAPPKPTFSIINQKVFLDLDLRSRSLKGKTEIIVCPSSSELKVVRLNCRQLTISQIQLGRKTCSWKYVDAYERVKLPYLANVHHHQKLRERIGTQTKHPPEPELEITLPKSHKIIETSEPSSLPNGGEQIGINPSAAPRTLQFEPFVLSVTFAASKIRSGFQFVGWEPDDLRYPHVFTRNSARGALASLFPCVESVESKCTWEVSIRSPRTIADALSSSQNPVQISRPTNGEVRRPPTTRLSGFSNEDRALDLMVICSGDMTDEIADPADATRKTTSFLCSSPISVLHIGFAIGPFEEVNLAAFRDSDEDDKLGRNAIPVHGFCLPGRSSELENTCFPLAKAMDYFVVEFGSFPFPSYKLCFVDDMDVDRFNTASLTMCSSRMLFPENVIDPLQSVTRELVHGLASQWSGVGITPKEPGDLWVILGMSYFITDLFLRKLCGNNEYRFLQKRLADRVCEMDVAQPSLYDCGRFAWIDASRYDLIAAKAPLVLFILDRRLAKSGGSTGVSRIVTRMFLQASLEEIADGMLDTSHFLKFCDKLGHANLESFFKQWVYGSGCPRFRVTQRFNKKRLVVEMQISQAPQEDALKDLEASSFVRTIKEQEHGLSVKSPPQVFTGPMTIRIHEADGTPYEHIVEIKDSTTRFDIPYNTKYKRLKRNRRQRDRAFLAGGNDDQFDGQVDVLLYCLGDVLQSEEEMREWRFAEWSKEDEERMNGESYEWIRMDADFEWICQMTINMPGYMFVSQLQQDRDVVAQYETIQYLASQKAHGLVSTILTRTLLDSRYFHGIRTLAAAGLSNHAREETNWLGWFHLEKAFQELFCLDSSVMTRSNEFSDRASYFVQCAIPRAIADIRDNKGRAPISVRKFLFEKLRFNDNSNNEFSDCFYVATLMKGLAEAMASAPILDDDIDMEDDGDDYIFLKACLDEIERYRRLDEWIPSYHNTVSITALESMAKLAKAGINGGDPSEFLLYTREGHFEELRVASFKSLIDLGLFRNELIIQWAMHVLGYDTAPFIRLKLIKLFETHVGSIAIGEEVDPDPKPDAAAPSDGLIIEQESTNEARKALLARKTTMAGALAALKAEVGENEALKAGLWDAISSPIATIPEVLDLLTICRLLYEPSESKMVITIPYPRYWKVASIDRIPADEKLKPQHVWMHVKKNGPFRQKPFVKAEVVAPPAPTGPANASPAGKRSAPSGIAGGAKPLLQLTHKAALQKQPPAAAGANGVVAKPAAEGEKPKLKIMLKVPPKPPGSAASGNR